MDTPERNQFWFVQQRIIIETLLMEGDDSDEEDYESDEKTRFASDHHYNCKLNKQKSAAPRRSTQKPSQVSPLNTHRAQSSQAKMPQPKRQRRTRMPIDVFDDLRIYLNKVKNAYWELHELLRIADRASIFSRIADVDWCYKCAREDLLNYRDREGMTDIYHVPEGDDIDFYCEVPSDPLAPTILAVELPRMGAHEASRGSTQSETSPKSAAGKSALEEVSDDEANSGPVDKLDSDTVSGSSGQGNSSSESVHEPDKAEKGKVASRARSGRPTKRIRTDQGPN